MNSATVCLGARRYWVDGVKVETVRKCMSVSSWSGESVSEASWHSPFVRWGLSVCVARAAPVPRDPPCTTREWAETDVRSAFGSSLPFFRST